MKRRTGAEQVATTGGRALRRLSVATASWGLAYAAYRLYYAAGGTVLLPGVPASPPSFRLINGAAAAVIAVAGLSRSWDCGSGRVGYRGGRS